MSQQNVHLFQANLAANAPAVNGQQVVNLPAEVASMHINAVNPPSEQVAALNALNILYAFLANWNVFNSSNT